MNIAVDLILVFIAVLTVILYTKNGFIKSVFGTGRFIISIILAYSFTPYLGNYISGTPLYYNIETIVLNNFFSSSDTTHPEALSGITLFICNLLAFIIILFVSCLLVSLLGFLLKKLFKLPVLHHFDKAAGLCLGVVCAIINLFVFTVIIALIINMGVLPPDQPLEDNTLIYKYICQTNVVSHFMNVLYGI